MAKFYDAPVDVRYTDHAGTWLAISGTLKNTGVATGDDGRKIVPAGTAVYAANDKSIVSDRADAIVTLDDTTEGANDATHNKAECLTFHEHDVTDGDVTATFFVYAAIDLNKVELDDAAITALTAKGFEFVG